MQRTGLADAPFSRTQARMSVRPLWRHRGRDWIETQILNASVVLLSAADTEPSICRSAAGTEPSLCPFVHSAGVFACVVWVHPRSNCPTDPQTGQEERRDRVQRSEFRGSCNVSSRVSTRPCAQDAFWESESRKRMQYRSKCDHCKNSYAHST